MRAFLFGPIKPIALRDLQTPPVGPIRSWTRWTTWDGPYKVIDSLDYIGRILMSRSSFRNPNTTNDYPYNRWIKRPWLIPMDRGRTMPTSNDKPYERGRQKLTNEDMSQMVDPWAPQAFVCSPFINPYMEITCTLCSKTLFTRLCLPNMRRKAPGSLSINSISSTQGKILCSWDLGCSSTTIRAPSLLIPKVCKIFLALTLLSSWWSFLHWLNL